MFKRHTSLRLKPVKVCHVRAGYTHVQFVSCHLPCGDSVDHEVKNDSRICERHLMLLSRKAWKMWHFKRIFQASLRVNNYEDHSSLYFISALHPSFISTSVGFSSEFVLFFYSSQQNLLMHCMSPTITMVSRRLEANHLIRCTLDVTIINRGQRW